MSTKTASALTVEQAVADLEAARADYDTAVRAVVAGNSRVTAKDVADAQDAVRFAELRVELAHETQSHGAEERRRVRIAELVQALTTGTASTKGREVVDREAQAVAALEALYLAATDYKATVRGAANELGRLGELPDNVEVEMTNHQPGSVIVDGIRIDGTYNIGDWTGEVLLGAIHRALEPHYPSLGDKAKPLANTAARALSGNIRGPKFTATEMLAAKLERIAGSAA